MFENTLIISPHCDDETIGCGGLIHNVISRGGDVHIAIMSMHTNTYNYNVNRIVKNKERFDETLKAMEILGVPRSNIVQYEGYEDGKLDTYPIKFFISNIDKLIRDIKPTAVLFPYSSHHQDHQVIYQASIASLRSMIDTNFIRVRAAYEYPYITTSWNSNLSSDTKLYYVLTAEDMQKKKLALESYVSQLIRDDRDILSVNAIMNLAKTRGTEIGQYYAEAFYPLNIISMGGL